MSFLCFVRRINFFCFLLYLRMLNIMLVGSDLNCSSSFKSLIWNIGFICSSQGTSTTLDSEGEFTEIEFCTDSELFSVSGEVSRVLPGDEESTLAEGSLLEEIQLRLAFWAFRFCHMEFKSLNFNGSSTGRIFILERSVTGERTLSVESIGDTKGF